MKKNWIAALIIFLALGATITVFKFGVKKAVESSREQTDGSSPSTAGGPNSDGKTDSTSPNGQASGAANSPNGSTSGSSSATTGTTGTTGANDSAAKPVAEVKKIENNCFAFEYRHTKDAQNKDIEDFLDLSNAFAMPHKDVNAKSLCVKVNNKPVAFKMNKYKSQDEVMIGSVVGPESVIRVSYCVGKVSCKEACAVTSNRFMDDMMSDAGDDDDFKDSWGDADSADHKAKKKELQGKVKELRSVASENKDLAQRSVVRTWDTLKQQEWVCKK